LAFETKVPPVADRAQDPARDTEPHEAHEWTDAEITALLNAASTRAARQESHFDYTPLMTVAAKAGLRLGECLGLDWPDVELVRGKGMIKVRQQWTRLRELALPKAGSRRVVPISDDLVLYLAELKMASPDKTGPVFASRVGGRLSQPQRPTPRLRASRARRRYRGRHVPQSPPRLRFAARGERTERPSDRGRDGTQEVQHDRDLHPEVQRGAGRRPCPAGNERLRA
jgi:integrase